MLPNQSLELMNVDDKLTLINSLIDTNDYDVAVKESCLIFEVLFRKIAQKALASLPFRDRADILQAEEKIGRGTKGIEDFGFGELVGLFRQANLLDKWSTHNGIDMGLIKSLDFSSIVNLRNQLTHQ